MRAKDYEKRVTCSIDQLLYKNGAYISEFILK